MSEAFVNLLPAAPGSFSDGSAIINSALIDKALGWTAVDDQPEFWDSEVDGGPFSPDMAVHSYVSLPVAIGARWTFKLQRPRDVGANNVGGILRVFLRGVLRRRNLGSGASAGLVVLNNGVSSALLSSTSLSTDYIVQALELTTDPVTGAAWRLDDFDEQRIEIGYSRLSATGGTSQANITQVYLQLVYTPLAWAAEPPSGGNWAASDVGSGGWVVFPTPGGTWVNQ